MDGTTTAILKQILVVEVFYICSTRAFNENETYPGIKRFDRTLIQFSHAMIINSKSKF